MKNGWFVWLFIIGIIVVVFVAFNFHGNKEAVPLSEIFPEEETYPVNVEYEFVNKSEGTQQQEVANKSAEEQAPASVVTNNAQETTQEVKQTVSAPEEAKNTPEVVSDTKGSIPFTIQVASFNDIKKAEAKSEELKKEGYPAFIFSKDLGTKGMWYRVYVGKFDKVEDAEKLLVDIKKKYTNSFIISPK